jgi:glutamate carboxypeptidase
LKVEGRASHAGGAPERGVNALYELSHQIMQMRNLSEPANGLKLNWTISQAGTNRNVIPAYATAVADVRVLKVADYDRIEAAVRERAKTQLLPEAKVTVNFERRRPPLEVTAANRRMAAHAQTVYAEIGKTLVVDDRAEGGGTDAAFAALRAKGPVSERWGIPSFGGHSADNEWVMIDAIQPRLYLAARMVMELSAGRGL